MKGRYMNPIDNNTWSPMDYPQGLETNIINISNGGGI